MYVHHVHSRTDLSQVDLVEHHQAGAAVVVHQAPEVLDRVGQWVLGDDEGGGLSVALQGGGGTALYSLIHTACTKTFVNPIYGFGLGLG